jgi:hypothetical protein
MELGSYFLFLQEQIKDIIIISWGWFMGLVHGAGSLFPEISGKREPEIGGKKKRHHHHLFFLRSVPPKKIPPAQGVHFFDFL